VTPATNDAGTQLDAGTMPAHKEVQAPKDAGKDAGKETQATKDDAGTQKAWAPKRTVGTLEGISADLF
jgi:hypothetical protein